MYTVVEADLNTIPEHYISYHKTRIARRIFTLIFRQVAVCGTMLLSRRRIWGCHWVSRPSVTAPPVAFLSGLQPHSIDKAVDSFNNFYRSSFIYIIRTYPDSTIWHWRYYRQALIISRLRYST